MLVSLVDALSQFIEVEGCLTTMGVFHMDISTESLEDLFNKKELISLALLSFGMKGVDNLSHKGI